MMMDVTGRVIGQTPLKAGYWALDVETPGVAEAAQPGQFVHVRVPGLEPVALRRPFSIYGAQGSILKLLYKTVGRGTAQMNRLVPGDTLQVIGPLGNGFPLAPQGLPLLVAGGYGVAPLSFLAGLLPVKGVVLIGGRTADDVLATADFERLGWTVRVATQDGSLGEAGLVTVPLDRELARLREAGVMPELFACGPDGLLRAVGERAVQTGCRGWLSLDKHMVCGVGACLACVQTLRRADGTEWIGRVCHDGPIFEAREIVW
ncbi:MAG: dihydroorotate dehydrogenase electron transfer subunit [Kiritimatiellae bacterium]|jgi:dihydroorotate dehydrogenase electron transfer subunit|nr:dihydroorotate dehydrogenase electron transfer subunit [Kiritimatiellia bacterium]NLG01188.1 dihydroorotate dehydrogenase electron transfer subunit [Lentisphaerota bacterium]